MRAKWHRTNTPKFVASRLGNSSHIGTNTPKFVPSRWGRPSLDPTQTGLCKFGWVWSSLKNVSPLLLLGVFAPMTESMVFSAHENWFFPPTPGWKFTPLIKQVELKKYFKTRGFGQSTPYRLSGPLTCNFPTRYRQKGHFQEKILKKGHSPLIAWEKATISRVDFGADFWSFSTIFGQFWSKTAQIESKSAPFEGAAPCAWRSGWGSLWLEVRSQPCSAFLQWPTSRTK